MAVNDTDLTVVGWVGNDPRFYPGSDEQVPYTQLRLASTPRVYDPRTGTYTDGTTDWFTVKVFRSAAQNVAESVRRGDPLVVRGRLQMEDWESPDGHVRTTAVVVASAIGHNLGHGTSRFVRTVRPAADGPGGYPVHAPGHGPVDLSGAVEVDEDGRLLPVRAARAGAGDAPGTGDEHPPVPGPEAEDLPRAS